MPFKLTPEQARAEWVKALRSGKYEQTRRVLHKEDDGYCCLGVACEVFNANETPLTTHLHSGRVEYGGCSACLPSTVRDWLGIRDEHGGLRDGKWLTECNDMDHETFAQIADRIERGELKLATPCAADALNLSSH